MVDRRFDKTSEIITKIKNNNYNKELLGIILIRIIKEVIYRLKLLMSDELINILVESGKS